MPGFTFHPATGVVYNSKSMNDLACFMERLYDDKKISIVKQVRTIKLHLPYDNMNFSGIRTFLKLSPKDPAPHRLPGNLGLAADVCCSIMEAHRNDPYNIPHRKWFQVIVQLLRCCKHIETLEVPAEWGDVQWYDYNFPAIDLTDVLQQKRQLPNGRWRWGRDPVVLPEYLLDTVMTEVPTEEDDVDEQDLGTE